ncbi:hypothetical protein SH2C18_30740 [Clostridium sediminicola]|uniref:HAMP domain-containing protein n=1 Tax=Clostridium sediminicola TaxID=3114879 RepID=UPI0031F2214C
MIKNFINKIHVQITFIIILSLGISIGVYSGFSELNEDLSIKRQQAFLKEQSQTIINDIPQIKFTIDKNDMTFEDVLKSDIFKKYDMYNIFLTNSDGTFHEIDEFYNKDKNYDKTGDSGNHFNNLNLKSESLYIFNIQYKDCVGFIMIEPNMEALVSDTNELLIGIFAICLFLSLLFLLSKKQIKYIKKINDGIEIMAGGQLLNKLPIEGNNELTSLAVSINNMAFSLRSKLDLEKELDSKQRKLISNICMI